MDFGNGRGLVSPGPPPRPSPSLAPTPTASLGWPLEALPDLFLSPPAVEYVGGREGGREGEAEGWGRVDGQPYLKLSSGFLRLVLDVRVWHK